MKQGRHAVRTNFVGAEFANIGDAGEPTDMVEATGIVPRGMRRILRNRP